MGAVAHPICLQSGSRNHRQFVETLFLPVTSPLLRPSTPFPYLTHGSYLSTPLFLSFHAVTPEIQLGGMGSAVAFCPQRVRAEPGCQMAFST